MNHGGIGAHDDSAGGGMPRAAPSSLRCGRTALTEQGQCSLPPLLALVYSLSFRGACICYNAVVQQYYPLLDCVRILESLRIYRASLKQLHARNISLFMLSSLIAITLELGLRSVFDGLITLCIYL